MRGLTLGYAYALDRLNSVHVKSMIEDLEAPPLEQPSENVCILRVNSLSIDLLVILCSFVALAAAPCTFEHRVDVSFVTLIILVVPVRIGWICQELILSLILPYSRRFAARMMFKKLGARVSHLKFAVGITVEAQVHIICLRWPHRLPLQAGASCFTFVSHEE